ncbi:hypothetical protein CYY_007723 [Polysphondylium violaceum]|uniref:Adenylate kinase n=1 Tax=Polysphondylium violaceum TaxID=133409 RepID=A0A8J4UXH8_9MYCE|nr:hypothetical protein CYY_007723 [Polysphondylium violaceum]
MISKNIVMSSLMKRGFSIPQKAYYGTLCINTLNNNNNNNIYKINNNSTISNNINYYFDHQHHYHHNHHQSSLSLLKRYYSVNSSNSNNEDDLIFQKLEKERQDEQQAIENQEQEDQDLDHPNLLFQQHVNDTTSSSTTIIDDDLEIKDPAIIFNTVWNKLEQKYGKENMRFPQEIILVAGAPGSGKGVNTPFISSVRGITGAPIVMSSLLDSSEAREIKSQGGMVSDSFAFQTILEELRKVKYRSGVVVDGFPRTTTQVELTNALYEKMKELRRTFFKTPLASCFPRPIFRVTVLFVEEKESVERQLKRGQITRETNIKLKEQGLPLLEERDTDCSEEAARKRYKIFRDHYPTLQTLKKHFPFSIIDASKTLDRVQQSIIREFKYQSSLELSQETYDLVQRIPLVTDITLHARVDLVTRLDDYQNRHTDLFTSVVHVIEKEFVPTIRRHSIAGSAMIRVTNSLFSSALAIDIALDVLSERGFRATVDVKTTYIPHKINPTTYEIESITQTEYQFKVDFEKPLIREEYSNITTTHMMK